MILTPEEVRILKKVCTSRADAEQILQRCKPMLEVLDRWEKMSAEGLAKAPVWADIIGCPHCGKDCSQCAYLSVREGVGKAAAVGVCLRVTFGGICLEDVSHYSFVRLYFWDDGEQLKIPPSPNITEVRADIAHIRTFLLGHIEWAEMVLAMKDGEWK